MYNIKEEYEKIKTSKKTMIFLAVIFIIGIILIISSDKIISFENAENVTEPNKETNSENSVSGTYDYNMEALLEKTVSNIKGVGECDIIIKYNSSAEKVIVYEKQESGQTVITESDSGRESPFIIKEKNPEIEGVIVVCEGGGNDEVKKVLSEAISEFLGISLHKVKVCEMKGAN